MLDFLVPFDGPVVDTLDSYEIVYAKKQPEYNPLRTLRGSGPYYPVLSRWTLTPEQRQAVIDGADVYLELYTFGKSLSPIRVGVGKDVDSSYIREQYSLP